ncbi:fibrinogen C domain-containing protein 1-A-like [Mya arenaria]|uniref:fibrinogen C domain-containing protein 1-A-like n=1 Tax=Mya arenaria TaxID=6604 RepID=UPI0022E3313E|nr:fibrinogen C domain-containing protein 1-A-like [Mya arenaria]
MFVNGGILLLIAGACEAQTCIVNVGSETVTQSTDLSSIERRVTNIEEELERLKGSGNEESTDSCCDAIYKSGKRENGIYTISPDGRCPFDVFCDMTNGGWTVIQKRFDGSVNFYKPWTTYVNGFGSLSGEHWLGLEKIHRLTSQPVDIYFNMTRTADRGIDYAHYKYFTVQDATTKYTMWTNSDGYEGTLRKTVFTLHNGMKFTTYDQDNDAHPTLNCADPHHGAWWFKACYQLGNMNGLFGVSDSTGLNFHNGSYIALSESTIKIKMTKEDCQ